MQQQLLSAIQRALQRQRRERSRRPHEQNVNEADLFKEIQDRCTDIMDVGWGGGGHRSVSIVFS